MVNEERSPLLSEHHAALRDFGHRLNGGRDPLPGDPPPPYSAQGGSPSSATSAIAIVMCRVCHGAINVSGKTHQHVVKCPACNEATPIRNAPAGKKYVRCPCNCLLVCKSTSHLIACPRQHCKRVINLGPHHDNPEPQRQSAGFRVACGHCARTFLWTGFSDRTLIRCPTCHKVSSIGRRYPRRRSLLCFMLFIALAASTAGLMVGTWSHARDSNGIYVTWVILILLAVFSLVRTFYWRCLKISMPVS